MRAEVYTLTDELQYYALSSPLTLRGGRSVPATFTFIKP